MWKTFKQHCFTFSLTVGFVCLLNYNALINGAGWLNLWFNTCSLTFTVVFFLDWIRHWLQHNCVIFGQCSFFVVFFFYISHCSVEICHKSHFNWIYLLYKLLLKKKFELTYFNKKSKSTPVTVNKDFLPFYKNESTMSLLHALPPCTGPVDSESEQ